MKFGFFDDVKKEYVIQTPKPPLPWINYLGCKDFFSLYSNTCGGYSFYKDAKLLRLTRYRYNNTPLDMDGKYYFIKEGNTIWNPGWKPTTTELDSYECHHGLGYTNIISSKNGITSSLLAFVPLDDNCEINQLTLSNKSSETKSFSVFSYVEFCLWNAVDDMTNFQRNLSIGEVEISDSTIFHKTEYRERRNHYAFFTVNQPIAGFDTSKESFLGAYRSLSNPEVLEEGASHNSVASGWSPIASQQINITLAPGEEKTLIFVLGYIENPVTEKWESFDVIHKSRAFSLISKFKTSQQVRASFEALRDYWNTLLSKYSIHSTNAKLDRMVNIWNQYQCMVTFNLSRSASYYESGTGRGMGFRDSCQDLLGFVHLIPDRARERILDIASTQFEDGSAYHQYQPLTKKGNMDIGSGFNDDPLWLVACVSAYLKETGDFSILHEQVPFDNKEDTMASLLDHCRRSIYYTLQNLGPHKLPLIGRADWNDCLNLNCFSSVPGESFQTCSNYESHIAESVFIAGMFVKYGKEYAEICEAEGLVQESMLLKKAVTDMENSVLSSGWDGEWFLRAYDAHGNKIGSKDCTEGQIFIEPQGFCVLAGIGSNNGFAEKALTSVKERLDTIYGIVLQQPPYLQYHIELGEISSYPPGYKENAGIFCHNNPWISIAETTLGHGNRAFEIYQKTAPAFLEDISEIHRTEPYVYSQMIAGKDAASFGEAKNSWLTGTAAWTFVNISQYILGIKPTLQGLMIDPCIPSDFGNFKIIRMYRGITYHIEILQQNQKQKGISSLTVNGKKINGNIIPFDDSQKDVQIAVTLS